jgi:hypothetical protein
MNCYMPTDIKGWTTFNKKVFVANQKYEHGGGLKVTINILFFEESHEPLHLDKWSLAQ